MIELTDFTLEGMKIPESWPDSLKKSLVDPFTYAAYIRGVGVVVFETSSLVSLNNRYEGEECSDANPDWVHLENVKVSAPLRGRENVYEDPLRGRELIEFSFDRGMDVRVSYLVWVADAPWGS